MCCIAKLKPFQRETIAYREPCRPQRETENGHRLTLVYPEYEQLGAARNARNLLRILCTGGAAGTFIA